jgi:hypothetical protein
MDKNEACHAIHLIIKNLKSVEEGIDNAIDELSDASGEVRTSWRWLADLAEELEKSE